MNGRVPPVPRLPYYLLGLLSLCCFGGPLAMWLVMQGGASDEWPPDRIVEWVVVDVVVGAATVLFLACVTIRWWYPRWADAPIGEGIGGAADRR